MTKPPKCEWLFYGKRSIVSEGQELAEAVKARLVVVVAIGAILNLMYLYAPALYGKHLVLTPQPRLNIFGDPDVVADNSGSSSDLFVKLIDRDQNPLKAVRVGFFERKR